MDNVYTIKEAVQKYVDKCEDKVQASVVKLFVKSVLAGIMIAMGAAGSSVAAHTISDVGLARMAAAVVFPVGLMMVILLGAELFTGDCLMTMGTAAGRHHIGELLRVLFTVYIGNFVGAALLAMAVYASGQFDYSKGILGAYTIKIALGKVNLSFGRAFISGVLCNILVCAAVLMAACAKDITGKLWASFFGIMLFVMAGFEHCVANMYYITAGMIAKMNPDYLMQAMKEYGYTMEQLSTLNIQNFLMANLLPVTIGNIAGGILIGLSLFYLNDKKTDKEEDKKKDKKEELVLCK